MFAHRILPTFGRSQRTRSSARSAMLYNVARCAPCAAQIWSAICSQGVNGSTRYARLGTEHEMSFHAAPLVIRAKLAIYRKMRMRLLRRARSASSAAARCYVRSATMFCSAENFHRVTSITLGTWHNMSFHAAAIVIRAALAIYRKMHGRMTRTPRSASSAAGRCCVGVVTHATRTRPPLSSA